MPQKNVHFQILGDTLHPPVLTLGWAASASLASIFLSASGEFNLLCILVDSSVVVVEVYFPSSDFVMKINQESGY